MVQLAGLILRREGVGEGRRVERGGEWRGEESGEGRRVERGGEMNNYALFILLSFL